MTALGLGKSIINLVQQGGDFSWLQWTKPAVNKVIEIGRTRTIDVPGSLIEFFRGNRARANYRKHRAREVGEGTKPGKKCAGPQGRMAEERLKLINHQDNTVGPAKDFEERHHRSGIEVLCRALLEACFQLFGSGPGHEQRLQDLAPYLVGSHTLSYHIQAQVP